MSQPCAGPDQERSPVLVVCADSADYLRTLPADHFHACVTDPPYGLGDPPDAADVLRQWANRGDWSPRKGKGGGFMGCTWDRFVPGPALWAEVLRVLRPGAYCAVFAGTRAWDWMSLSLRFAGFEVTDTLMWLYGQGFPKGGDVGKRIDEMLGAEREVTGVKTYADGTSGHWGASDKYAQDDHTKSLGAGVAKLATAPATPEAAWDDCSTTLKPAWEPILLAQKPHRGSVARNCVDFGAGALRIGACRVESGADYHELQVTQGKSGRAVQLGGVSGTGENQAFKPAVGRWPANVVLDEVAGGLLDEQSGFTQPKPAREGLRGGRGFGLFDHEKSAAGHGKWPADPGNRASRFFYCAKASGADRDSGLGEGARNRHPTVKPEALMRWLAKLVTPPGGELLDPFGGSGSTGKAAALEGFRATIVEREPEHAAVAEARVADALRRAGK